MASAAIGLLVGRVVYSVQRATAKPSVARLVVPIARPPGTTKTRWTHEARPHPRALLESLFLLLSEDRIELDTNRVAERLHLPVRLLEDLVKLRTHAIEHVMDRLGLFLALGLNRMLEKERESAWASELGQVLQPSIYDRTRDDPTQHNADQQGRTQDENRFRPRPHLGPRE